MKREDLKGKLRQLKRSMPERWGKVTQDDLDRLTGRREEAVETQSDEWWTYLSAPAKQALLPK